ncbi:hypothetical protein F4808DRAFT_22067 [Astrocystis sublimbata]|nr:hypothetical protein F4808DRAFT_22067 [Astrocystis sublimbata]
MEDDNNSFASFEDIVDRTRDVSQDDPTMMGTEASSSADNGEDDVPDVCYVLQRYEIGKGLIEVCRGAEPIDPEMGEPLNSKGQKAKKPVLEIVTEVASIPVSGRHPPTRRARYRRSDYRARSPDSIDYSEDEAETQYTEARSTSMVIHSRHLINALAAVVTYDPSTSFTGDKVEIEAPYYVLVHHRAALARYKYSQPETHDDEYANTTVDHIEILLGFLEQTYGQMIQDEEDRNDRKIPAATWDWLWLLLRPGDVIYTKRDDIWSPFAISRVSTRSPDIVDALSSYNVDCWNYVYSSGRLRREMHRFEIRQFAGEEAILNLPVIPARFFMGEARNMLPSEVTAKQIQLGKLVWELHRKPSYKSYDGQLVKKSPRQTQNNATCASGNMDGRVIVDSEGFEQHRRRHYPYDGVVPPPPPPFIRQIAHDQLPYFASCCRCLECTKGENKDKLSRFAEFRDLDPKTDNMPEDDLYLIVLSKIIAGFLLDKRQWGHFHVEKLSDINFDKEAFKYLVLEDEIKTTVKALIGKFASADGQVSAWPSDFVKNKGQGRIFLLHGSPGVGKTCTAECVAELTRRPLLCLTSGDLGTLTDDVEKSLEYFLNLGERFGAIVLLDEADVYLEKRRDRDLERNGLVSVFLRALEYYRGVLFLTTNRVRTFDSAFTSRIHVALHYGALKDSDRERIWLNGFERVEREAGGRVHVTVVAREYVWGSDDVRALQWNGREIRNALQTAVGLAESEASEEGLDTALITEKHLRSIVVLSKNFMHYMQGCQLQEDES